ncbi:HAD domain-containing protein [Cupriavidus basilensis]|uniref:HAD domain-containing protein n=1 Tax=Cupriavidus basilensis TaxID=68895 RepID=UPI00157A7C07|nr:HAD domain-containing protein [Cupriavidus basilensis]NUA30559.1 hypothetical protein [Cupriavidus basilensis]
MILFLDYDGVLHPDAAYLVNGRPELHADGELFMWSPILEDIIRPYVDLRIVLSTSWVRVLGFSRARDYLSAELSSRVIGGTWHSGMRRHSEASHRVDEDWFIAMSRYEQIARYIARAGPRAASWLAVDDDVDGWDDGMRDRLVETDGDVGLSSPGVQEELRSKLRSLACK